LGDPAAIARSCYTIARSLWGLNDREGALPLLERAVALYKQANMPQETIRELERLASCCQEMGRKERAGQYRQEAAQLKAQASR
jgi:hypothetical protein